jgi:hypothetical protein
LGAAALALTLALGAMGASLALGPRPRDREIDPGATTLPGAAAVADGGAAPAGPGGGSKQRGVALGMFAEDVSFSYGALLKEIAALGATHVALVIPLYQTDGRSDDLAFHTRLSPALALIAETTRAARREGLEVMLLPIVRLAHPAPGEWRGTLAPARPDEWFRHYGELLADLAALAAQTGVTRLCVGSELSTLDGDLSRWRPLVAQVRDLFPGRLVYSANWDHYRDARLFDLVDEEGIAGYFRLRDGPQAASTLAALVDSWRRHKDELSKWHAGRPRPLVFTEVGYRSRSGATAAPWDETSGGVPDLDEQRRAFTALRQVWAGTSWLEGAYVWNWYGWGGERSAGYTPRGKPAAEEVARLLEQL